MGTRVLSRRPSKSPQVGDMRDRVSLYDRAIQAPVFGTPNITQEYTLLGSVWSSIETIKGPTVFDDVDTKKQVTIEFKIRYRSDVTSETRVLFSGDYYEILEPTNNDKRDRFMFLRCALLGDQNLEVNR